MSLNGDRLPPQANPIGDQLGLGSMFTPGAPAAWSIATGKIGDDKALFLIFNLPNGRMCVTLDTTAALALSDQLREQAGGITIPRMHGL